MLMGEQRSCWERRYISAGVFKGNFDVASTESESYMIFDAYCQNVAPQSTE